MKSIFRAAAATIIGSLISVSAAASTGDLNASQVRRTSLECATIYMMLLESPASSDEQAASVLNSQAVFMSTIYYIGSMASGVRIVQGSFNRAVGMVGSNLINKVVDNRDAFVDDLIRCEGWREQVLQSLVREDNRWDGQLSSNAAEARKMMDRIPPPRESYALSGVSRMELNLLIDNLARQYQ